MLLSVSFLNAQQHCEVSYHKTVPMIDNNNIRDIVGKFDNLGNEKIEVIIWGDSNVASEGTFSGPFKQKLWDMGLYCGTGWHSMQFNFAPLGTFNFPNGDIEYLRQTSSPLHPTGAPAGGGIIHDAALMHLGSSFSFSVQAGVQGSTADHVDFYYEKGTGDFEYKIANGSWIFVENSTGSGVGEVNYVHPTVTTFGFAIRPVEDGFIAYGINRYVGGVNGVLVHKAGFSGYGAYHTTELITIPSWSYIVADLAPDIAFVTLGSNGSGLSPFAGFDTSPDGYALHLTEFFNAIQSASPNTQIQYMGFPDRKGRDRVSLKFFQYMSKMCQSTEANGWGFSSLYEWHGPIEEAVALGHISQDSVHYTSLGGVHNKNFLCRILEIE